MSRRLRFALSFGALTLILVGCAPIVGGGWTMAAALVGAAFLSFAPQSALAAPPANALLQSTLLAGPPRPRPVCDGWEHKSCGRYGKIEVSCCPKNMKCNYAYAPLTECGYDTCVPGRDEGRCPERQARITNDKTRESCGSSWAKACIEHRITEACIVLPPSNYSGPPPNPPFLECVDNRCTTSKFRAACYPTKAETKTCKPPFSWRKICLMGKVEERCVPRPPTNFSGGFYKAAQFTMCDDGTCIIGTDKNRCR